MPYKGDNYTPKKSSSMPKQFQNLKGDGDLWIERLAYDGQGYYKRSFFQSVRSDHCEWDEPPTGKYF